MFSLHRVMHAHLSGRLTLQIRSAAEANKWGNSLELSGSNELEAIVLRDLGQLQSLR